MSLRLAQITSATKLPSPERCEKSSTATAVFQSEQLGGRGGNEVPE
jgi:hypothetical protein